LENSNHNRRDLTRAESSGGVRPRRRSLRARDDQLGRFVLARFYTLHVWAWKDNPTGTFVNWHANISCDAFVGENK